MPLFLEPVFFGPPVSTRIRRSSPRTNMRHTKKPGFTRNTRWTTISMEPNPRCVPNAGLEALRVAKPGGMRHYRTSETDCEWSWRTFPRNRGVDSKIISADPPSDSPRRPRPWHHQRNYLRNALPDADDIGDIGPGGKICPARCGDNADSLPVVANAEPPCGNGYCSNN